jgi:hypothetical protein
MQASVITSLRAALAEPKWGREVGVVEQPKLRADRYILLSQCCDIVDGDRILVAVVVPGNAAGWGSLTVEEAAAFRANQLGVPDDTGGAVRDDTGGDYARLRLVLPGYFYLEPSPGVFDTERVVVFGTLRGLRKKDLRDSAVKVAELHREARAALRLRLGVSFGRVPREDEVPPPVPPGAPSGPNPNGSAPSAHDPDPRGAPTTDTG